MSILGALSLSTKLSEFEDFDDSPPDNANRDIPNEHWTNAPEELEFVSTWVLENTFVRTVTVKYEQGLLHKSALLLLADPLSEAGASVEEIDHLRGPVEGFLSGNNLIASADISGSKVTVIAQFESSALGLKLAKLLGYALSIGNTSLNAVNEKSLQELVEAFKAEVPEDYIQETAMARRLEHFLEANSVAPALRVALRREVNSDFELGGKMLENRHDLQLQNAVAAKRLGHDPSNPST